jgi:hypothetical protein
MQTYSREFLQSLPDKKKQQEVDAMIRGFWQSMYVTAENGQTSYFFDMSTMRKITPEPASSRVVQARPSNSQTTMTNEEIVTRFQAVFTDCNVRYGEEWVDSNASTRVLKRGITIDWS